MKIKVVLSGKVCHYSFNLRTSKLTAKGTSYVKTVMLFYVLHSESGAKLIKHDVHLVKLHKYTLHTTTWIQPYLIAFFSALSQLNCKILSVYTNSLYIVL